jgi:hypothetical protein
VAETKYTASAFFCKPQTAEKSTLPEIPQTSCSQQAATLWQERRSRQRNLSGRRFGVHNSAA